MIETKETGVKKQRDCNFITLHDTSLFSDLKLPSGSTNHVLWYKKSNPAHWGLTIKKFDDSEEFGSQHVWKITWVWNDLENILVPTKASTEFTECITGDVVNKLLDIRQKYLTKKK